MMNFILYSFLNITCLIYYISLQLSCLCLYCFWISFDPVIHIGLADENESVREAALSAGHVLVEHYATSYVYFYFLNTHAYGVDTTSKHLASSFTLSLLIAF